jgi:hypothetical protein
MQGFAEEPALTIDGARFPTLIRTTSRNQPASQSHGSAGCAADFVS